MSRMHQLVLRTCLGIGVLLIMASLHAQTSKDMPASIPVRCGNLAVRFEGAKFWTLNRIEYKGTLLCIDYPGSHYGSVVKFPGIGFIGTGHRENEDEKVLALRCFVDGEQVEAQAVAAQDAVKTFRIERETMIRDLLFTNAIEVRNDRIYESVALKSAKEVPVDLIYNFMHPWTTEARYFLAGTDDGDEQKGAFTDSKEYMVNAEMDWSAVYAPSLGKGIVSRLLAKPDAGGAETLLWDVPNRYRKFYLRSFATEYESIPAGFEGEYKLVTGFFEADKEGWEQAARELAEELQQEDKAEHDNR